MLKLLTFLAVVMAASAVLFVLTEYVEAHDLDEFTFTGEAVDACHTPGATWSIEWTIANDLNANPFGIIDADTSDGQDVLFAPLLPDVGDGYIPDGDDAHATTTHASGVASVTLTVEHDVSGEAPNTEHEATVNRPAECLGSITVTKDANGAGTLDFDFSFNGTSFHLDNDESRNFPNLSEDSYLIDELGADVWQLTDIDCDTADTSDESLDDGDIRVHLAAGEDVECVFTNKLAPTPTATSVPATATAGVPTATPAPTSTAVPATVVQPQSPPVPQVINNNTSVTVEGPSTVPVAPAAPVVPAVRAGVITAPNTGSGGIR